MRILLVLAGTILLIACAASPGTAQSAFDRLAAQVEIGIRQAEKSGFLWRDTEQLLQDARQANKQGRDDEAMQLAQQAMRQAQLAQQQAKENANAAPVYPAE